ncbi:hypothetical protein KRX57_07640 [Weeksellaceae bacterium TAE3-ERU29]|nr:hypothetical protein [Weeksellaceae bacterium TAE3-ERU29]
MKGKILELENELKEIKYLLNNKLEIESSFEDIDKSIMILAQKNESQYSSILKKINNFSRMLYETGLLNNIDDEVYNTLLCKLNKVDEILTLLKDK